VKEYSSKMKTSSCRAVIDRELRRVVIVIIVVVGVVKSDLRRVDDDEANQDVRRLDPHWLQQRQVLPVYPCQDGISDC
jgi:hypothetical protein